MQALVTRPEATSQPVSDARHHIACCVDGSEASLACLAEARRLAALSAGSLSVVYVDPVPLVPLVSLEGAIWVPDLEEIIRDAHEWLSGHIAGLADATGVVLIGHPAGALCDWALGARPDLLVVWERDGWLRRLLFGRPASYLSRHAPCPVVVVRERRRSRRARNGAALTHRGAASTGA